MAGIIGTLRYAFVEGVAAMMIAGLLAAPAGAGNGVDSTYLAQIAPGYVKVFADEFPLTWTDSANVQHTGLNTGKWWTRYVYSGGTLDFLNDEVARFRESGNHVIDSSTVTPTGHTLHLTTKYETDGLLSSGMVRSKREFIGGYFEARIRKPPGRGQRPAFWLNSGCKVTTADPCFLSWPPEIDILDDSKNAPDDASCCEHAWMTHTSGAQTEWTNMPQDTSVVYADPNFNTEWNYMWVTNPDGTVHKLDNEFHIWGLLWEITNYQTQTGRISTYLDGKLIVTRKYNWVYDDRTPAGYAHVLVNLAMGGSYGGDIDASLIPQAMDVDYVRVYQDPAHKLSKPSSTGTNLCPTDGSQC